MVSDLLKKVADALLKAGKPRDAAVYLGLARQLIVQQCIIDKQTETIKKLQVLIEDFANWKPSVDNGVVIPNRGIIIP